MLIIDNDEAHVTQYSMLVIGRIVGLCWGRSSGSRYREFSKTCIYIYIISSGHISPAIHYATLVVYPTVRTPSYNVHTCAH